MTFFPSREVAVEIFGFGIHWYGLLYLAAFLNAWWMLPRIQKHRGLSLSKEEWSSVVTAALLGVIIGGRLGYVLFYDLGYFLSQPLKVIAVWEGGMSSHGGFLGVLLALWLNLRHKNFDLYAFADIVTVPIAIGLACGRVGNFINLELYGTVTSLPWGIEIPGVEGLRHPTQLYAVFKDLFIALICYIHLLRSPISSGKTMALFLMLYGSLRFTLEFLREQDVDPILGLSRGQLLTLPLIAIGMWLYWKRSRV